MITWLYKIDKPIKLRLDKFADEPIFCWCNTLHYYKKNLVDLIVAIV